MCDPKGRIFGAGLVLKQEAGKIIDAEEEFGVERTHCSEAFWRGSVAVWMTAFGIYNGHVEIHLGPISIVGSGGTMGGGEEGQDFARRAKRVLHWRSG